MPAPEPIPWEWDHIQPSTVLTHKKSLNVAPIVDAAKNRLNPHGKSKSQLGLEALKNIIDPNAASGAITNSNAAERLEPMELLTHVKSSDLDDANEHPSSHSEIPADDITDPDRIDPHQKKKMTIQIGRKISPSMTSAGQSKTPEP